MYSLRRIHTLSRIDFIVFLYYLYGVICLFIHKIPLSSCYIYKWGLLLLVYITCRIYFSYRFILHIVSAYGFYESIIGLLQFLELKAPVSALFKITGSFSNPGPYAGLLSLSALSSLFLGIYYSRNKTNTPRSKAISVFMYILFIFTVCIIFLSNSRASIVSLLGGSLSYLFYRFKDKITKRHILFLILISGVLFFVFSSYKRGSIAGRLLIWRVSLDMIISSPIYGHGPFSVERQYMLYQRDYFKAHPQSTFRDVGSNNRSVYNEFIHLTVEEGILGLIILSMLLYEVLFKLRKNGVLESSIRSIIIGWLLFGSFSYPSEEFVLNVVLVSMVGLSNEQKLNISKVGYMFYSLLFIIVLTICVHCHSFDHQRSKIMQSILSSERGNIDKDSLKKILDTNIGLLENDQYLYDRCVLSICRQSERVEEVEHLIGRVTPSCESYCAIGDLYLRERNYAQATKYFTEAHYMVPGMLTPIWYLFKMSLTKEDYEGARNYAKMIKEFPVKIENTKTLKYRTEAKEYLQNNTM